MSEMRLRASGGLLDAATSWQEAGLTVVYAGWDGKVQGLLGLGERLRPEASQALSDLREMGIETSVLTGDPSGGRYSERLSVPVYADLSPEDKLRRLEAGSAAMVGDGINDGPALAAATVGIAVNGGADVAQSAADVVLLREDLSAIPWLFGLTRAVQRKVRQNLGWAVSYNAVGITLAMAGLLQPVLAALAMVFSSLLVTYNALRLRHHPGLEAGPDLQQSAGAPAPAFEVTL